MLTPRRNTPPEKRRPVSSMTRSRPLTKQLQGAGRHSERCGGAPIERVRSTTEEAAGRDSEDLRNARRIRTSGIYNALASKVYDVMSPYAQKQGLHTGSRRLDSSRAGPLRAPIPDITQAVVDAYNAKSRCARPPPAQLPPAPKPAAPAAKPPARWTIFLGRKGHAEGGSCDCIGDGSKTKQAAVRRQMGRGNASAQFCGKNVESFREIPARRTVFPPCQPLLGSDRRHQTLIYQCQPGKCAARPLDRRRSTLLGVVRGLPTFLHKHA